MEEQSVEDVMASKQAWTLDIWQQDVKVLEKILSYLEENRSLIFSSARNENYNTARFFYVLIYVCKNPSLISLNHSFTFLYHLSDLIDQVSCIKGGIRSRNAALPWISLCYLKRMFTKTETRKFSVLLRLYFFILKNITIRRIYIEKFRIQ